MNPGDYWKQKHAKYSGENWITRPTIFATQVLTYFPGSGKLLELGAGQGQDTAYFALQGYRVTCSDFSEFALNQAKLRLPQGLNSQVAFQIVDLVQPLPFPKESFDVVYSHLALHYFDADRTQALFDEIFEILKPGGIFATLTNTINDPEVESAQKIDNEYYESGGIQKRFFSVGSMKLYTRKFEPLLLDSHGETHKDTIKSLIRFVGRRPA